MSSPIGSRETGEQPPHAAFVLDSLKASPRRDEAIAIYLPYSVVSAGFELEGSPSVDRSKKEGETLSRG